MKAYIGPYVYQWNVARATDFWYDLRYKKNRYNVKPSRLDAAVEKILHGWHNSVNWLVNNTWGKRSRQIRVRIEGYDAWSAGTTLSYVIYPMLLRLKKDLHGAPFTDDQDVPEGLRSTNAPPRENTWDTDDYFFERWDWILDEMIWTFEVLSSDDTESRFFHEGKESDSVPEGWHWVKLGDQGFWVDRAGEDAQDERISNGLRLFGKYYQALWD